MPRVGFLASVVSCVLALPPAARAADPPKKKPGTEIPEAPAETRVDRESKEASEPVGERIEGTPTAAPDPTTFEGVARGAAASVDLGTLLGPFHYKCGTEKREIDRVRCQSIRRSLKRALPQRVFVASTTDPAAISVTDYDARIKGYKLAFAACLACTKPVSIGASGEKRFVTLRVPGKDGESLASAVELKRNNLSFETIAEAQTWLKNVRPNLRAEFVFQPTETEWSFGVARGYAFKLLGGRIYDRCTGDVLVSAPPSTGQAEKIGEEEGCPKAQDQDPSTVEKKPPEDENLPPLLNREMIAKAMGRVRGQVYACFQQFEVPGTATLTFTVAGNGMVQGMKLSGAFEGTPTGECVVEAVKSVRFERFKAAQQKFAYPFVLR